MISSSLSLQVVLLALTGIAVLLLVLLVRGRASPRVGPGFTPDIAPGERIGSRSGDDRADPPLNANDVYDLSPEPPPRVGLTSVHEADPDFSEPAFLAEAGQIYAAAQRARATGELGPWRDRLFSGALEDLLAGHTGLEAVTEVIQDLPRIVEANQDGEWAHLEVAFQALLTECREGEEHTLLAFERWAFARRLDAPGTPWQVLRVLDRRLPELARPPLERAHTVGTGASQPTVTSPNLQGAREGLTARAGVDALGELLADVPKIFGAVQAAWEDRNDAQISQILAPEALESWAFARARLERVGLRRRVVDPRVTAAIPARLEMEGQTVAATVRIQAHTRAWLETLDGAVVGGNPEDVLAFSEYWTFLLPLDRPDARWRLWQRTADEEYMG